MNNLVKDFTRLLELNEKIAEQEGEISNEELIELNNISNLPKRILSELEKINHRKKEIDEFIEPYKQEKAFLISQEELLKQEILDIMEKHNINKLDFDSFTFTRKKSSQLKVIIDDEKEIKDVRFLRVKMEPDKNAIKEYYKETGLLPDGVKNIFQTFYLDIKRTVLKALKGGE